MRAAATAPSATEPSRLDGLDSAFLAVETPAAPMHITGLAILEAGSTGSRARFESIRAHLAPRLRTLPVFRRHLREVPMGLDHPVWVERDVELGAHLQRLAVPAPGSLPELAGVVGHLAGLPLDRSRPLWKLWVLEGLECGRTAVLVKIHHALADGTAGAELMAQLLDADPEAPARSPALPPAGAPARAPSRAGLLLSALGSLVSGPYRAARQTASSAAAGARGLLAAAASAAPSQPVSAPLAPDTPLNGALTPRREVALGSLPLQDLHSLKRAFGVKLNDVLLAVCAGALRRHLRSSGALPTGPLVAAVPVSLASPSAGRADGNRVSAITVSLPVHLADPIGRLNHVRRSAARAKRTHRAVGGELLSAWADLAPPALLAAASALYSRLDLADRHPPVVNLVVSNVPGPSVPLYCAGHRVRACYPMGPIFEGCALNLTVFSYDGRLDFGLLACPDVVTDLPQLATCREASLAELRQAARPRAA